MTTQAVSTSTGSAFGRFAGLSAILAGIVGLLYAVAFVVLHNDMLSALFLLLGGLFSVAALTGVYQRLRESEPGFALLGWFLGIAGALGALIHGGYDLSNALHPPALNAALADLPSPIDPRGLLTFGITGMGIFIIARLMGRSGRFSVGLSYLGYALAVLLCALYPGRLILLDPKHPFILVDALISGFVVNPLWYLWLGSELWK